jgi:predicted transcriptional regulator
MKKLKERLALAKIILYQLSRSDVSRSQLEKKAIIECGTHSTFEAIFQYLIENGYVEKTGREHRALYRITDKGKRFFEGI